MGHSTKKLDLIGMRFGRLTALRPAENIGSRTAWVCRCNCGKEILAKTVHLRNSHVSSCGCIGSIGKNADGGTFLNYVDGTCVEMLRSKTVRRSNTSGVPGVDWLASRQRWRATICFKGKRYYLGSYARFDDAVKARKQGEEDLRDQFLREFAGNAGQAVHG